MTEIEKLNLDAERSDKLTPKNQNLMVYLVIAFLLVVAVGILTGYFLSGGKSGSGKINLPGSGDIKGKEVGSTDTSTFKDTAVGILEKDGFEGEGTHKLVREGGPSQTAYLTSSIIDLDEFVGKKVQVWGETFKGQKVAWLMDVGRIKEIE